MHTNPLSRFFLVGVTLSLVATALMSAPAAATDTTDWSDISAQENVLVQSCPSFNITSSYSVNRAYHVVKDYTGATVYERRDVSFTGTIANALSGQSLAYEGKFERTADYDQGIVRITDLELRLGLPNPDVITVTVARQDHDLIDNPPAVFLEFAPSGLRVGLCSMLDGDPDGSLVLLKVPQFEIDPCDTTPSEVPC
jgi:hypothetical protein